MLPQQLLLDRHAQIFAQEEYHYSAELTLINKLLLLETAYLQTAQSALAS